MQIGRRPPDEIHDRLGDLFRVAIAAHRKFGDALRFELRVKLEPLDVRIGHDHAGADRLYVDVLRCELVGHRARKIDEGRFRHPGFRRSLLSSRTRKNSRR